MLNGSVDDTLIGGGMDANTHPARVFTQPRVEATAGLKRFVRCGLSQYRRLASSCG
jgi:hypothetical protein